MDVPAGRAKRSDFAVVRRCGERFGSLGKMRVADIHQCAEDREWLASDARHVQFTVDVPVAMIVNLYSASA